TLTPDLADEQPSKDRRAPGSLTLAMDEGEVRKAEAYAASRGTSLSRMVADFLRVAADDVVTISMPTAAARPVVYMLRHGGADQVASFLSKTRWDDLKRPVWCSISEPTPVSTRCLSRPARRTSLLLHSNLALSLPTS